jgi:glutathione S-transferase
MQDKFPVLYSFRRCPYAMRARLALAVSQQACIHREIKLRAQPAELLAISPKGTVPVLDLRNGVVLEESLDIMLWTLSRHDPEGWLALCAADLQEARRLIGWNDGDFKRHLDRYKYPDRYPGQAREVHRAEASLFLTQLNQRLTGQPFLFGAKASLADMAILPFVRQFAAVDREWFDAQAWSALRHWLDTFTASARFASIMDKHEVWRADAKPVVVDWVGRLG